MAFVRRGEKEEIEKGKAGGRGSGEQGNLKRGFLIVVSVTKNRSTTHYLRGKKPARGRGDTRAFSHAGRKKKQNQTHKRWMGTMSRGGALVQ